MCIKDEMITDYFNFAFKTFKERRVRTYLTMLGIFIGIALVVSLITLGQSLQAAIQEQFEMMGSDKILVLPSGGFFGMGSDIELTRDDLDVIKKVNGVDAATGFLYKITKVEFRDEVKYTYIFGTPQDAEEKKLVESMTSMRVVRGRELTDDDRYKAVVGIRHYDGDFFEKTVNVRDKVLIEDEEFKVVGVLNRIGNPEDDSTIIIHMDTARELFDEPDKYDMMIAKVVAGTEVDDVAERIKKALRKHRDVEEGEEDFDVQTSGDLMETYGSVFLIVQLFLIGIAGISLFVGGVGIMNTMYTSVLQRTRDIGIMKAIGAKNSDIMVIFLIESGLLGLAGGAVGVLMGIGVSFLIGKGAAAAGVTYLQTQLQWPLLLGTLAFSFVVGAGSGLLPAIRASRLNPVDALRYE